MHIALVSPFPPSRGTLNEYGLHFAKALAQQPELSRLSLVADSYDASLGQELFLSKDFPIACEVQRVWSFNDVRASYQILSALKKLKPDAVIFNLQFASFGDKRIPAALGLFAPLLSRLHFPTITLLHNIVETVDLKSAGFGQNPLTLGINRMAGQLMSRILLQSHYVGLTMPRYVKIYQEVYGAKNVFLSPHCSFSKAVAPKALPKQPTVMAFGKFGTYKKLEPLCEAHAKLLKLNPNVRLVIAGSDSPNARGYLAAIQGRYGHLSNLEFTGYVPEEKVVDIFADSTVVAFPYESTTGSSGVLHQAGEFARAVVMPYLGDLADLIEEEGYQASYFEAGKVESLRDALWSLLSSPEKAAAMGQHNYKTAQSLSLDHVVRRYIDYIEAIKSQKSPQGSFVAH
ncbi:MAG: glycosyltransferase [Deinococcales bacterium]